MQYEERLSVWENDASLLVLHTLSLYCTHNVLLVLHIVYAGLAIVFLEVETKNFEMHCLKLLLATI